MIEPWDFRFQAGEADRLLGTYIPRESLLPINQRYYRDLGADLEEMGTFYDLYPRPEKAALAYTEFVTHGRMVNGGLEAHRGTCIGPVRARRPIRIE